jgi:hypothetical protein
MHHSATQIIAQRGTPAVRTKSRWQPYTSIRPISNHIPKDPHREKKKNINKSHANVKIFTFACDHFDRNALNGMKIEKKTIQNKETTNEHLGKTIIEGP